MKKTLLAFIGLVLVLTISVVFPLGTAFADYEDILVNQESLVNFNQYVTNDYTHNVTRGVGDWYPIDTSNISLNYGDIVYLHVNRSATTTLYFAYNGGTLTYNTKDIDSLIVTQDINLSTIRFYVASSTTFYSLWFINLTQMFGSGNEPNLQQCEELFVSDYYSYSTGTTVSLSGFGSYSLGYSDALANTEVIYSGQLLQNNVFANSGSIGTSGSGFLFMSRIQQSYTYLSMGFMFPSQLNKDDQVTVLCDSLEIGTSTYGEVIDIYIGYYQDGAFISLGSFNSSTMTYRTSYNLDGVYYRIYDNASVTFSVPSGISTIYFNCSGMACSFVSLTVKAYTNSIGVALQDSYNRGYEKAQSFYKSYYSDGGVGYQAIYDSGYYAYPTDDHFTFKKLISAVIDTPVQAFTTLFDFDILGVNMKTFYLSVFTLCVIITIIRLVL